MDNMSFLIYSKNIMIKSKTKFLLKVVLPLLILIVLSATVVHRFFPGIEDESRSLYPVTQPAEMQRNENFSINRSDNETIEEQKPFSPAISHNLDSGSTLINFALHGTANSGTKHAMAVIENKKNRKQKLYKIGDRIENGIITDILQRVVIVLVKGKNETLHISRGFQSTDDPEIIKMINRMEIDHALKNIDHLMAQLSIKPHILENGNSGLLIENLEPGSMFDKLGFLKGDIIKEINGAEIKRPEMLAAIYNGMKTYPFKALSLDLLGPKIDKVILGIDNQAGGIAKETMKVYRKGKSGDNIPLKLIRNGLVETIVFKVK